MTGFGRKTAVRAWWDCFTYQSKPPR